MLNAYDITYALGVAVSSPVWLLRPAARRKVLKAFRERMGHIPPTDATGPAVMIHAVSLGEINATRGLVTRLRELRPDLRIIISATTETGYARALELYAKPPFCAYVTVIHYPLDFTAAVARVLDTLRPSAVVLMELEAWPNFTLQCRKRGIPVILVNGRLTEPSFKRYRLALPIIRRMFARLALVCAQEQVYADRFIALGAVQVRITGTMKFDTAMVADRIDGDADLAADLGLGTSDNAAPVWVCGSTGPGEERIILECYRKLLAEFPALRLAIIPRKPERFDEVAALIQSAGFGLLRRSSTMGKQTDATQDSGLRTQDCACPVLLGDTMGELRKFYSLAAVVFVGRTLVDLGPKQHGSDMMEPAGLAKPVIVGPYTGNFADVMARFRTADAMREVNHSGALSAAVRDLLRHPPTARALGLRARQVVIDGKGATEHHAQAILPYLAPAMPALSTIPPQQR